MEKHRGRIQVESRPGQGTRFAVRIPRAKRPPAGVKEDSLSPVSPNRRDGCGGGRGNDWMRSFGRMCGGPFEGDVKRIQGREGVSRFRDGGAWDLEISDYHRG